MPLKILVLFLILFILKAVRSYEFLSISDEQIPFTIDICKLYRQNSAILLYAESEEGKDIVRFLLFFFISTTFVLFIFRNGNGNDDVQMEACTFSRRHYDNELALFAIARIIVLRKANSATVLYRDNL